jgi:large subunit ribosomal protein L30
MISNQAVEEAGKERRKTEDESVISGSLLVVNLRGMVNTRAPVRKALEQLHLVRRFNATIVPNNKAYMGMLKLCKEHIAWSEADPGLIEKLLRSRAEVSDGHKVKEEELNSAGKRVSFAEVAKSLASGESRLDGSQGFRQFFRLNSPRGGFKRSIRRQFHAGGILGPNPELGSLVESMIV